MSKLKKFEVVVEYRGTLTYVVEAPNDSAAVRAARTKYDKGVEPDNLMTDWEQADKITAKPL